MNRNISLLIFLLSISFIASAQNGMIRTNTTNTPLYTLFAPMAFARNNTTPTTTGVPAITQATTGNVLTLTNANGCEGVAAAFSNKFNAAKDWQLKFTYTLTSAGGAGSNADGIALVIHNDLRGTNAVGGSGASLGCDVPNSFCGNNGTAIATSMQWQFEVYSGAGNYGSALKTTNALATVTTVSAAATVSPVTIATNVPIDVTMRYVAATNALTVTLYDGTNTKTFNYTVNLSTVVGSSAYLAFTGATGGLSATQTITKVFMLGYPL